MSIYSHDLSTDLCRDNNNILYLENHVDFCREVSDDILQEYLNELTEDSIEEAVDVDEGYGGKLRPVFIVLIYSDSTFSHTADKFVKNQKYWHAAIGFGPSLSRTYSFNFGEADANKVKGGLSFESYEFYKEEHPTGTMEVNCIFLTPKRYKKLKETLDYYLRNKEKTRYSFINLLWSLFGHKTKNGLKMNLVCSTFVDTILRSVDIHVTDQNKNTNLTKPDDLRARHEKQFKLYEGPIPGYNIEKVHAKVNELSEDVNNDWFADTKKKDEKHKNVAEAALLIFGDNSEREISEAVDYSFFVEMTNLGVSFFDDIDTLDEGVIEKLKKHFTNLKELKNQWKKFADTFVSHEWIFRYITSQQEEMINKYYHMLTDEDTTYSNYKKAFRFFCKFMGLTDNKVILENIVIEHNNKDSERTKLSVKYSKGLVKVHIPEDVYLVHVSPVKGIKELIPSFRSKVKGKYMYPSKRVFFTVKGEISKNQAGLEGQQVNSYKTKQHYDTAYIDPTYSHFKDGCVYIETDTPIPVENKSKSFNKLFEGVDNIDQIEQTDQYVEEGLAKIIKQSFNDNWKTSDQSSAIKRFKSNIVTEEEYEELYQIIKTLKYCETYQEYKPAFWKLCKYCHIVPNGTIISNLQLKSGSTKDKNFLLVEYAYNNRKIKLEENQQLFHISKIEGIKELKPFFRGKSERGYLYDKPRIYLTVYEKMPKIMADYSSKVDMHHYRVIPTIKEAYVDPLLRSGAMGAIYIETNKPIPVQEFIPSKKEE